jgi:hypothetical protein
MIPNLPIRYDSEMAGGGCARLARSMIDLPARDRVADGDALSGVVSGEQK